MMSINRDYQLMKIIIVDNDEKQRNALADEIAAAGYRTIHSAESADKLYEELKAPSIDRVCDTDLIIMNAKLPGTNGIETCQYVKSFDEWRDIPILIVSEDDNDAALEKAFNAGANDFISTPWRSIPLLSRVMSALRTKMQLDSRTNTSRQIIKAKDQLQIANEVLQQLSKTDPLTDIANRNQFDISANMEWKRALRDKKSLATLMIDIDFFKLYNDTYGHLAGDKCLSKVAETISISLSRPGDFVARYGGEEFSVLLPDTDIPGAVLVAEKISENIRGKKLEHKASKITDHVTICCGVHADIPSADSSLADFIKRADDALYKAKQDGRNCVRSSLD